MGPISAVDASLPPLEPFFELPSAPVSESPAHQSLITALSLEPHIEGGYFAETDRDYTRRVPNPFVSDSTEVVDSRAASTSIHYLLTPVQPLGAFHRNRARTVHTLHKGRGRYVVLHADEVAASAFPAGYDGHSSGSDSSGDATPCDERDRWTGRVRVETFVVGQDVAAGERLQWVVEGGKYKASFLLPDREAGAGSAEGLLISETVVPGFEYADHDFMTRERFEALVAPEQQEELRWLVRAVDV